MKALIAIIIGLVTINLLALLSDLLWSNSITATITWFTIFTTGAWIIRKAI